MRIAYDMSSVLWTGLFAGKDEENGYAVPDPVKADKMIWVNSYLHGYENCVAYMVASLKRFNLKPIDTILVFEGMHSKKMRQLFDTGYKEGDEKAPDNYKEFEKLRALLRQVWLDLGATAMQQDHVEGDDVLAWLARETEQDLVIRTGDGDLTVLNGVNAYGSKISVVKGDNEPGVNPYGPWDSKLITAYKALVGDTSDKIKGVVGFGKKSFEDLLINFGEDGVSYIQKLLEAGNLGPLHAQADEDKLVRMICDQEANAVKSYRCARLYPERVNLLHNPLQMQAGMVKGAPDIPDERLQHWYAGQTLVTAANYDQVVLQFKLWMQHTPFVTFDIETSTPDESDEWLARQSDSDRVDTIGSVLTGFSLTLGDNCQYTAYFSVDHADTDNITVEQARLVMEAIPKTKTLVIHNTAFELPVCYNTWAEFWQDNGFHGFLPNIRDTLFECSYVDENSPLGLKWRSKNVLGYEQQTYDEVTKLSGLEGTLPKGGKQINEYTEVDGPTMEQRRYKMRELSAQHVVGYGCDDTICTAALHVFSQLVMELEHTWQVYLAVEISAAYQHAVNFLQGIKFSVETNNALSAEDDITYDKAWEIVREFLIESEFEGTVPPEIGGEIADEALTAADVKELYTVCTGKVMKTQMRVLSKLAIHCREVEEEPTFALLLENLIATQASGRSDLYKQTIDTFNQYINEQFKGEPENPVGSPKKMNKILYEVMKLPVRVRNKATDKMRQNGVYEGNPKADALAIAYALQLDATPEQKNTLEALKLMQMVQTRRGLFYTKWPFFIHWKDGMVHPSHQQCATNTRRASEATPNKTQLSKHEKIEGQPPKIRSAIVPHAEDAVVVSMDFSAQELHIIADYSQDANLLACYIGDNRKDVHSMTGTGIYEYKIKERGEKSGSVIPKINYDEFEAIRKIQDKSNPLTAYVKDDRNLGKKVNFTTEFGAMAPKVAQTLLITEDAAQAFINAKESAFPQTIVWKQGVIAEAKELGYVRTMLGGMRHLQKALNSGDRWIISKAERQAVNFKVQGSAAEQTKLAEGRVWEDSLSFDFDCVVYGPIHDEVVASVLIEDLYEFIPRMHKCMIGQYADIKVPIESSISFGPDFWNQTEIGDQPIKEAIDAGLIKMYEDIEKRKEAERLKQLEKEAA